MSHYYLAKNSLLLVLIWFFTGCSYHAEFGQPNMVISGPGKYPLAYYKSTEKYPGYSIATVGGREFLVTDGVVIPSVQSLYMLKHWQIFEGETVLDIGTGSGVQAVFAAVIASSVVATDIYSSAVEVAKLNVERHGMGDKVEVRQGDLFEPIGKTEKFDVILFNIDYPYSFDSHGHWKLHERFFADVKNYLKPGGRIYYQSGIIGNITRVSSMIVENEMTIISMRMDALIESDRQPIVYLIKPNSDLKI